MRQDSSIVNGDRSKRCGDLAGILILKLERSVYDNVMNGLGVSDC
jgi:hypothetical protein